MIPISKQMRPHSLRMKRDPARFYRKLTPVLSVSSDIRLVGSAPSSYTCGTLELITLVCHGAHKE